MRQEASAGLLTRLARTIKCLHEDVEVVRDKDPAVTSSWEVLLYPHLHALWLHRLAHRAYRKGRRLAPRALALLARLLSGGIDIHPGASIGRRFFIDHGTGVVIGETARIGDDVMLYHLVTLGSVGWWKDLRRPGARRHPKLEDRVVVGTGACVLGPVVVGSGSIIGANAMVLDDLPPNSHVPASTVVCSHEIDMRRGARGDGHRPTVPPIPTR